MLVSIRLHGKVSETDLNIDPSGTAATFRLDGNSHSVPVNYRGVLPDLFKPGAEVAWRFIVGKQHLTVDVSGPVRANSPNLCLELAVAGTTGTRITQD